MSTTRERGKVKWFDRGFGWITPNAGGPDVFVHRSEIRRRGKEYRELVNGEDVEYTVTSAAKGPRAADVVRLGYLSPYAAGES